MNFYAQTVSRTKGSPQSAINFHLLLSLSDKATVCETVIFKA